MDFLYFPPLTTPPAPAWPSHALLRLLLLPLPLLLLLFLLMITEVVSELFAVALYGWLPVLFQAFLFRGGKSIYTDTADIDSRETRMLPGGRRRLRQLLLPLRLLIQVDSTLHLWF